MSQIAEPVSKQPSGWLREPLVHFIVLAAFLFLIDYLSSQARKEQIVVGKVTIDYLIQQREDLELRTLSAEERQQTIEQVFFSDSAAVPEGLLANLRSGLDPRTVGESRFDMRRSAPNVSRLQLVGTLGPEAARAVLSIKDDRWHGPIESLHGVHFIRLTGYRPQREQRFEDVERYIEGEWLLAQTRQRIEQELDGLRDDYDIVIEAEGSRL